MNPMADAIRKKRTGSVDMSIPDAPEESGAKNLLGLVASMSDEDRATLKSILDASAGTKASDIEKGAPGKGEAMAVAGKIASDDAEHEAEESAEEEGDEGAVDSDEIGRSMLDSRLAKGVPEGAQPRGLSDRVKFGIADKLKAKGKL